MFALASILIWTQPASAIEYPDTPAGRRLRWAVETVGLADHGQLDTIFTEGFLGAISPKDVDAFLNSVADDWGHLILVDIEESQDTVVVAVALATSDSTWQRIWVHVERSAPNKIFRIAYRDAEDLNAPVVTDWSEIDSLMGQNAQYASVAVWNVEDGQASSPIHRFNADRALGVGSAFKLWVLGALAQSIDKGKRSWDDTLAVHGDWKSLPSGRMQDDSVGTRYAISYFAHQMIAISDNTATDHLIMTIGREAVEAFMSEHASTPKRNLPFMTTREIFQLKIAASENTRSRYISASETEKRKLLTGAIQPLTLTPDSDSPDDKPTAIEQIEYFASTDDLCKLITYLDSLSQYPIHRPVAAALTATQALRWDKKHWSRVAYKGGSETGVLNLTWLLDRIDGRRFAVSLTWNDPNRAIDDDRAVGIGYALATLLREYQ